MIAPKGYMICLAVCHSRDSRRCHPNYPGYLSAKRAHTVQYVKTVAIRPARVISRNLGEEHRPPRMIDAVGSCQLQPKSGDETNEQSLRMLTMERGGSESWRGRFPELVGKDVIVRCEDHFVS